MDDAIKACEDFDDDLVGGWYKDIREKIVSKGANK